MKVFVAGATGALGRPLVRALIDRGHEAVAMTRSASKAWNLKALGAEPVVVDALDADSVVAAVGRTAPSHLVHLLTALPREGPTRPGHLRATNRLRVEGTANLVKAAVAAGVDRVVGESFVGIYQSAPAAGPLREDTPLPVPGPGPYRRTIAALRSLEDQLRATAAHGAAAVAMRYGLLYGPGVPSTEAVIQRLRHGKMFVPANGVGSAPFLHIDDAVSATIQALEHPNPAPIYNVVDDEPVPTAVFFETMAEMLETRRPKRLPLWMVRLAAPLVAESVSVRLTVSNRKIRDELGWVPRYPTYREGLGRLRDHLNEAA